MIKIILLLSILSSFAFSFEIAKSTTFTKNLKAELMHNTIGASIRNANNVLISKLFKEVIQISKDAKICTNGSYSIYPNYSYTKDKNNQSKQVFNGYNGRVNFDCKFEDIKQLDSMIEKMEKVSSNKRGLKLTINPIKWIVKDSTAKIAKDDLELMALKYIYAYQNYLSKVYQKQCDVKKVSLENNKNNMPIQISKKSSFSEPIKSDLVVNYRASYLFECK